jgi:hypothetical protein
MKDFYSSLGVDPRASKEEVATALKLHPELSGFSGILHNEGKRAVYDRTHDALKMIGLLRHRLGLDSGDSWFLQTCPDFAPRARLAKTAAKPIEPVSDAIPPGVKAEVARREEMKPGPAAGSRRLVPFLLAGLIAVILLLLIAYF